jgi:hypothetical protein
MGSLAAENVEDKMILGLRVEEGIVQVSFLVFVSPASCESREFAVG